MGDGCSPPTTPRTRPLGNIGTIPIPPTWMRSHSAPATAPHSRHSTPNLPLPPASGALASPPGFSELLEETGPVLVAAATEPALHLAAGEPALPGQQLHLGLRAATGPITARPELGSDRPPSPERPTSVPLPPITTTEIPTQASPSPPTKTQQLLSRPAAVPVWGACRWSGRNAPGWGWGRPAVAFSPSRSGGQPVVWPHNWGRDMSERCLALLKHLSPSEGLSFPATLSPASLGCPQLTKLPVFTSDQAGRRVRTNNH